MRKLKIAAFMPHPDDTEILVGGTLLKYKAQGHDVHVVIAMDGRRGRGHLPDSVSWQEIVAIRHEEARRACAILGVEPIFLDIEDHRLLDDRDCYEKVIAAMECLNPDVVFTCAPNDYHNDHRCLSRLVLNSAWAPVFFAETSCRTLKELQAKAKVTQTMTRDGLVVENQADGTVENISSREAEQDYSTDAEGKAEKILERAEDIKDGHKNKKKAKKAAETAATAESEDGLHGSAARLELTEDERADPALQPYIQKAGAKADKLDAARAALPKKRVPVKKKVYDAANGKAKSTLRFEQQDKGPGRLTFQWCGQYRRPGRIIKIFG